MYGQNFQSLTGNSDVSIGEKFLRGTKKIYQESLCSAVSRGVIDVILVFSPNQVSGSMNNTYRKCKKKINFHPLESFLKEKFNASNSCSLWILDTVKQKLRLASKACISMTGSVRVFILKCSFC